MSATVFLNVQYFVARIVSDNAIMQLIPKSTH